MELKFKIGNVIKDAGEKTIYIIIDIVFEETKYKGICNWASGHESWTVSNSYILWNQQENHIVCRKFKLEKNLTFVGLATLPNNKVVQSFGVCPQCNGELIEKYSEWAMEDIKKCKSCGWC